MQKDGDCIYKFVRDGKKMYIEIQMTIFKLRTASD